MFSYIYLAVALILKQNVIVGIWMNLIDLHNFLPVCGYCLFALKNRCPTSSTDNLVTQNKQVIQNQLAAHNNYWVHMYCGNLKYH